MNPLDRTYAAVATQLECSPSEMTGTLRILPEALLFESDLANCGMPLERLKIDRDDHGQVRFTDPEQPEWSVVTSQFEVLNEYFLTRRNPLRLQIEEWKASQETRRNLKFAALFLGGCAVLAGVVWGLSQLAVHLLVTRTPVAVEAELGRQAFDELAADLHVVPNPVWPDWFTNATNRLVQALPHRRYAFQFYLLDEPIPNAAALPGGRILVCRGLLDFTKDPETIAGVLAHEMAHVTQRHGLREIMAQAGPYLLLRLLVSDQRGLMAMLGRSSQFLLQQSYSRELEREADTMAWRHLVAARVDPRGLAQFFRQLADEPLLRLAEGSTPPILRSHPATRERIQYLDQLWNESPPGLKWVPLNEAKADGPAPTPVLP